nr:DUF4430 domain-containing protein [Lachnospiraceae bacterium]
VREQMEKDVISKVDAAIPAETDSDFEIPGSIENISYTDISVTSSDKEVVELKAGEYDYNTWKKKPTKAIVKQGTEAKQVTLTATFTFNRTDYSSTILFTKDYTVTVKPKSAEQYEAIRQELVKEIEEGINKYKFTDSVTGEELKKDGDAYVTTEDIQLPKPSRLGGNGSARPVWLSVDDVTYAKDPSGQKNARKVDILRPGVGKEDGIFHLTITVDDSKDSGVIASKTYTFKIKALTQKELGDELTLMKTVKEHYFDGIKGENASATEITTNLHNFREAWFDENQSLVWVYDSKYDKNHGITPDDIEGYDSMGSQKWRTFRTSNESVIAPENLLVTRQKEHTRVKIDSELTSKTFGKYGELYLKDSVKYAEYKDFAALYKQPVSVTVVVLGTNPTKELEPEEPASKDNTSGEKKQEEAKIQASFTLKGLDGETLIANTSVSDLQNGTTAFDVLAKVFKENGYNYIGSGYYIEGVKKSDGSTLYEKDAGKNSGWMYRVNGHLPNVSIGNYVLSDGDNIEFFFVNDYNNLFTKDGKEKPASEVKDEASSAEKKEEEKKDEKKEEAKVERQEVKNEDGTTTVTEKTETTKETKLEIVTKDESGKAQKTIEITVPKDTTKTPEAEVTQVVPKKEKLKISEDVAKEIQKNADSKKVEVTLRVNDDKGKEKYTVTTTAQNLANEEELFLYKLDEKGNKVLVNSKTYKKDEDGNFAVSVKTKGDYILCNAKEAKQVEKAILKTVQPATKSVTVASDQKITMNLSKKLDMDNVKSIKYVSTKKAVAKVSKNGKITAQHAGTVKIKAIVTLKNGEKKTVVMKVKVKKDRKK